MRPHAIVAFAAAVLLAAPLRAAAVVPFDVQVPLVLKALTYDRSLKSRAGDQVRVAILLPKSGRSAANELSAALANIPGRTVNGLPVEFREVAAEDEALELALREGAFAVVYVMPGFSRADLARIRKVCESKRMLAVAASVGDIENGMAFGIGAQGSKPQIVINLPASKACGSDFDLALIQLAKVVQ